MLVNLAGNAPNREFELRMLASEKGDFALLWNNCLLLFDPSCGYLSSSSSYYYCCSYGDVSRQILSLYFTKEETEL